MAADQDFLLLLMAKTILISVRDLLPLMDNPMVVDNSELLMTKQNTTLWSMLKATGAKVSLIELNQFLLKQTAHLLRLSLNKMTRMLMVTHLLKWFLPQQNQQSQPWQPRMSRLLEQLLNSEHQVPERGSILSIQRVCSREASNKR